MLHNITAEAQQLANSRYMTAGAGGGVCGGPMDHASSGGVCFDTVSMTFTPYAPAASIQRYFPASHVAGSGSNYAAIADVASSVPALHHLHIASPDAMTSTAGHHNGPHYHSHQHQLHLVSQQQQQQHHARLSTASHRGQSSSPPMGTLSTMAPSAPVYGPSAASPYQQFVDVVSGASLTIDDDEILLQRSGYALSPASLTMPQVAVGVPKRLTFSYDGENYTASQSIDQASPTMAPSQGCPCPTCIPTGRGASPLSPLTQQTSSPFSQATQQVPSPAMVPSTVQQPHSMVNSRTSSGAALSAPVPLASVDHFATDSCTTAAPPVSAASTVATPAPSSKQGKQALESTPVNHQDAATRGSHKGPSKSATHKPTSLESTNPDSSSSPSAPLTASNSAATAPSASHGVFQVEVQLHHNRTTSIISHLPLVRGAYVVYEGDRGVDMGVVKSVSPMAPGKVPAAGTPMVVRSASKEEVERWTIELPKLAAEAVSECATLVSSMKLKMRVREASYQLDKQKLTFFYETSESRVDFRKLLMELFNRYRCRIWMEKYSVERLGCKE